LPIGLWFLLWPSRWGATAVQIRSLAVGRPRQRVSPLAMYTAGTGLGVMLRPNYDVASRTIAYDFDLPMPAGAGRVFNLRLADADQDPAAMDFEVSMGFH